MNQRTRPPVKNVVRDIRRTFQLLALAGDTLHGAFGITSSMRAVLEALDEGGSQTVPGMARDKLVSRQHIQTIVDALADKRLVEMRDNPAHRRSPLIALTEAGAAAFRAIQRREAAIVDDLTRRMTPREMERLATSLARFRGVVEALMSERVEP